MYSAVLAAVAPTNALDAYHTPQPRHLLAIPPVPAVAKLPGLPASTIDAALLGPGRTGCVGITRVRPVIRRGASVAPSVLAGGQLRDAQYPSQPTDPVAVS